ncbi:MAG: adenylosuccinate lyase [Patescibacteria group bacterium]|nr:adenylosuccinate lyase [Patescibacteria group bacterium]
MDNHTLLNISPLDGRYRGKIDGLAKYFSEAALMRYRVIVEIEWFIFLCNRLKLAETRKLNGTELKELRSIYETFDVVNAIRVKEIESGTNHDVKAIEYFIKENLKGTSVEPYFEFIHFACTSEDITNLSYALMLKQVSENEYFPVMAGIVQKLHELAKKYKAVPMLSHTHGQPASPTTLGKELINYVARLERQLVLLSNVSITGKINGAVGNFNAHHAAYPKTDWIKASVDFVNALGFECNMYTTQIEPHDYLAEAFDGIRRVNTILIDLNRDIWNYISLGYFKQDTVKGEVGSSTMPHKVNPIDFENSEGNLGVANALLSHLSEKLPISRMQRDLTDSTVLRNIGSAISYSVLAYKSTIKGLSKLELNKKVIQEDLEKRWELLAEPIQTLMRKHKIPKAYEKLKDLTRGKETTKEDVHAFIQKLNLPKPEKARLMKMTPDSYTGLAQKLVESYKLKI